MVPVDSWLARISRLRNWSEIRLTIVSWADGATFYWIWDDLWLPWCTFLYSRMVLTILFSLLLGHLLVFVDSITWEANWELVFLFRLAFLYSSCVYRFSLSFRSATAISDVARACRSKKNFLLLICQLFLFPGLFSSMVFCKFLPHSGRGADLVEAVVDSLEEVSRGKLFSLLPGLAPVGRFDWPPFHIYTPQFVWTE